MSRRVACRVLTVATLWLVPGLAVAQGTIEVTTTAQFSTTACTLGDAINAANARIAFGGCATGDAIHVPAGVYTLTDYAVNESGELTGLPIVTRPITIAGDGPGVTIIRRDPNAAGFRLFKFWESFVIADMTLANGYTTNYRGGGAILADSFHLALQPANGHMCAEVHNVVFDNNYSHEGGAISDDGSFYGPYVDLVVEDSVFSRNTADQGGGIFISPNSWLTVRRSRFDDNDGGDWGGAIGMLETSPNVVVVEDTSFSRNRARQGGGAISATSPTLRRVTATGNTGGSAGGVLHSYGGRTQIYDSTFRDNSARRAGALHIYAGNVDVSGSTFDRNVATDFDGGAVSIDSRDSSSRIINSTLVANQAAGWGGAIFVYGGVLELNNVTVHANSARVGPGVSLAWWGGSTLIAGNSIITGNLLPSGQQVDIYAENNEHVISRGHNLIGTDVATQNAFVQPGDQTGTATQPLDARLLPLADNGGPTWTMALDAGSPARDSGSALVPGSEAAACESIDQRGTQRTGACDIGAFERGADRITGGPTATVVTASPSAPASGEAVTFSATVAAIPPATGVPTGTVQFIELSTSTILGTVALDANGRAAVTSVLPDGERIVQALFAKTGPWESSVGSVNVHVGVSPNVAPSFSIPLLAPTIGRKAGLQTIPGFVTAAIVGPATESNQHIVRYNVTRVSEIGSITFAMPPAISVDGTLTYAVTDDTSGVATFSVTLQDDGGTANGGRDTSDAHEFTITVLGPPAPLVISLEEFVGVDDVSGRRAAKMIALDESVGVIEAPEWHAQNTKPGNNITVTPTANVTVTFNSVLVSGDTFAVAGSGPAAPAGFELTVPAVAYDIHTTAIFSGPITVCLHYPPVGPPPHLMHYENGAWVDRTTSADAAAQVVCGTVSSLSPFAVFVSSAATGRMTGGGTVDGGYQFDFKVDERVFGVERGALAIRKFTPKSGKTPARTDMFTATQVNDVWFWDDPRYQSSRRALQPAVDSVYFAGVGTWNGAAGFTFEAQATDRGEPGRDHDTLTVTIRNGAGAIVASVNTTISTGNIQSQRIGKH